VADVLCEAELVVYAQAIPETTATWAILRWATRARLARRSQTEAEALVMAWVDTRPDCVARDEARRFVSAAYECEVPYRFGCGTGEGDALETALVYEACRYRHDRRRCEFWRRRHGPVAGREE